eukprot:UN08388
MSKIKLKDDGKHESSDHEDNIFHIAFNDDSLNVPSDSEIENAQADESLMIYHQNNKTKNNPDLQYRTFTPIKIRRNGTAVF